MSGPTNETGVYLHKHAHEWVEVGAKRFPAGAWHPVFCCEVCNDVICDIQVEVGA